MAVIGGVLLVSILLLEAGFTFAASELRSYGQDSQVAQLFVLWSWNSANLLAPPFSAILAGSTIVAFSTNAFPTWFRLAGVVLLAVILFLVAVLRAPGLAAAPGTLWLSSHHSCSLHRRGETRHLAPGLDSATTHSRRFASSPTRSTVPGRVWAAGTIRPTDFLRSRTSIP